MRLWMWALACGMLSEKVDLGLGLDLDRAQLQKLCDAATRIDAEGGASGRKLERLVRKAAEDQLGPSGVELLKLLEKTPPAARRKLLDEVLADNGLSGLDCPPLERIVLR